MRSSNNSKRIRIADELSDGSDSSFKKRRKERVKEENETEVNESEAFMSTSFQNQHHL